MSENNFCIICRRSAQRFVILNAPIACNYANAEEESKNLLYLDCLHYCSKLDFEKWTMKLICNICADLLEETYYFLQDVKEAHKRMLIEDELMEAATEQSARLCHMEMHIKEEEPLMLPVEATTELTSKSTFESTERKPSWLDEYLNNGHNELVDAINEAMEDANRSQDITMLNAPTVREYERCKRKNPREIPFQASAQYYQKSSLNCGLKPAVWSELTSHMLTLRKRAATPAERMRKYRARKEALRKAVNRQLDTESSLLLHTNINQEKYSMKNHNSSVERHSEDRTRSLPKKPATSAERMRKYRARNKALKNAPSEYLTTSSLNIQTDVNQENCLSEKLIDMVEPRFNRYSCSLTKTPATPAERMRKYRARNKALKNIASEYFITSSSLNVQTDVNQKNVSKKFIAQLDPRCIDQMSSLAKKPATPAERMRKYRARKKALQFATTEHLKT